MLFCFCLVDLLVDDFWMDLIFPSDSFICENPMSLGDLVDVWALPNSKVGWPYYPP